MGRTNANGLGHIQIGISLWSICLAWHRNAARISEKHKSEQPNRSAFSGNRNRMTIRRLLRSLDTFILAQSVAVIGIGYYVVWCRFMVLSYLESSNDKITSRKMTKSQIALDNSIFFDGESHRFSLQWKKKSWKNYRKSHLACQPNCVVQSTKCKSNDRRCHFRRQSGICWLFYSIELLSQPHTDCHWYVDLFSFVQGYSPCGDCNRSHLQITIECVL